MTSGTHPRGSSRAPRRRVERVGEDGRRLSTAGNGLVVSLAALVLGSLLTAPGMHKTAFNQQPGFKRDVALAITGPLAGASSALRLDRPRRLVKEAIGRGHDDDIDTEIALPPPTVVPRSPAPAGATAPPVGPKPARVAFTPKRKLRLWVAGDSLVVTPGWSIVRAAGASPVIQTVGGGVDGHIGTGLERPDVFNWFEHIATQVKKLHPKVVVLNFGANDDHGYMTGLPPGSSVGEFGGPSWTMEYRRRVAGIMDTVNRAGGVVVWIGLPITNSEAQTQRFDTINAVVQKEARKRRGRAIFVDTYTMFASETGGFTEYLPDAHDRSVKVRARDGLHFERAGGDMIARVVLKQLNELFDLTSWRRQPRGGATN